MICSDMWQTLVSLLMLGKCICSSLLMSCLTETEFGAEISKIS